MVRALVAQAIAAPRGPQWCCDNCQAVQAAWHPICDNCGAFDTLAWREPAVAAAPPSEIADLLPLMESRPPPPEPNPDAPPPPEATPAAPVEALDDIARRAN